MRFALLFLSLFVFSCSDDHDSEHPGWPLPMEHGPQYPVPIPVPAPKPAPVPVPPPAQKPPQPAKNVWSQEHNDLRCNHGVAPLAWSQKLAASAQAWANRCEFRHDDGAGQFGENLAIGTRLTPNGAMYMWYGEGRDYPYGVSTPPTRYMHFTQMVWRETQEIGCASASCPQGVFHVCRYSPPGNYLGRFATNVLRPTMKCASPIEKAGGSDQEQH